MLKLFYKLLSRSSKNPESTVEIRNSGCGNHTKILTPVNDTATVTSPMEIIQRGENIEDMSRTLGAMGEPAIEALYNALYQGDVSTRISVIYACGFAGSVARLGSGLRNSTDRLKEALERLSKIDRDTGIQITTMAALVRMGRTHKIKNLVALLAKSAEIAVQADCH